ncbi:MAG: cyclic nucleotide-binding domain-containing protein [Rhodospirillales bacterium]|nr:cyclic nucleotide-binding domain-containing protein [Rhodospirillales bacterium]
MTVPVLSDHEIKVFKKGSQIIRAGEMPAAAYLIKDGVVEVYKKVPGSGVHHKIANLGAGELIGEMALMAHKYHTLDVEAVTDAEVYVISREYLDNMLTKSPPLMKLVVETLLDRIYAYDRVLAERAD